MDLFEFTRQVANHLDGWTFGEQTYSHQAILYGPAGSSISLIGNNWDWERSPRVKVDGCWPEAVRSRGGTHTFYPNDPPVITVAIERGPEAVAKSITSRLLPKYLPLFYEQVDHRNAFLEREEARLGCLRTLATAAGGDVDVANESVRIGSDRCYGRAEVYIGENVRDVHLDLRRVPLAVAVRMLEILREDR